MGLLSRYKTPFMAGFFMAVWALFIRLYKS